VVLDGILEWRRITTDLHQLQAGKANISAAGKTGILPSTPRRPRPVDHVAAVGLVPAGGLSVRPLWRIGYRYDNTEFRHDEQRAGRLGTLTAADFPILAAYNPTRTPDGRLEPERVQPRALQLASDKSRSDATDNKVFLQYIVSLGAHGAHKF